MRHFMKLNKRPFDAIANGEKTIELRLCDEKRSLLKEGDEIEFSCAGVDFSLIAEVKQLHKFDDFKQLYAVLPPDKYGYKGREQEADYRDMYEYYTKEQIALYGVLGIELCNVAKIDKKV